MAKIRGVNDSDSSELHISMSVGEDKGLVLKVIEACLQRQIFRRIVVDIPDYAVDLTPKTEYRLHPASHEQNDSFGWTQVTKQGKTEYAIECRACHFIFPLEMWPKLIPRMQKWTDWNQPQ